MRLTYRLPKRGSSLRLATSLLLLCVLLFTGQVCAAKDNFDEYQVKAAFLFNLTNFVSWPESSFNNDESPFIVTILGNNPFGGNLQRLLDAEEISGRKIILKQIDSIMELTATHLLYINPRLQRKMPGILEQTQIPGLLLVSDYPGFCETGGTVNLLINKKRVQLEINKTTATQNQLKFSSKILRLATLFEGESR